MSCTPFKAALSRFGSKCAESLGLKQKPSKPISISAPFNFQEGPAVMFPGYSEDDISLMKEKAIASTAVVSDCQHTYESDVSEPPSRTVSGCGIGRCVVYHARKASKGCLY
ncbi:hypothetical protein CJF31_00005759 [Rutstroemia sp. NJR-2017a BVV2]|nr:hypothetical protein CJF31_00005759 [Rutstroemia sp. NJR-2017a BVV2]